MTSTVKPKPIQILSQHTEPLFIQKIGLKKLLDIMILLNQSYMLLLLYQIHVITKDGIN